MSESEENEGNMQKFGEGLLALSWSLKKGKEGAFLSKATAVFL